MIKNVLITLAFSLLSLVLFAQQEQHYTQFMHFKLGYNPGYAGSTESPIISAIMRTQWIGLEGAPETQVLSFHMPLAYQRVGLGFNLVRNTIGIDERITFDGAYAYRIALERGTIAFGLQASVRYLSVNYADDRLIATQPVSSDGSIPDGRQTKYIPNFGAGVYYTSDNFYVGLSLPRMIQNSIDFLETNSNSGREVRHAYLMAGVLIPLSESLELQPQMLLKYAEKAPFDAEANLMLIILKNYGAGLTYRAGGSSETGIGESLDFLIMAGVSKSLLLGLAYDYTLSDLKDYNDGSIEAYVRFMINPPEGNQVVNPRFF